MYACMPLIDLLHGEFMTKLHYTTEYTYNPKSSYYNLVDNWECCMSPNR